MEIFSICITHHKTPSDFFSKMYNFYSNKKDEIHKKLKFFKNKNIDGIFLLITCHRFELYISTEDKQNANQKCEKIIKDVFGKLFLEYKNYAEMFDKKTSIKHLLSVTTGIDSKIVGEIDIIEQVQKSYKFSKKFNNHNNFLGTIIEFSINGGRMLRIATKIESGINSYASIPYEVIKNNHNTKDAKILIIGMGMLGYRITNNLVKNKMNNIFISNRNYEKTLNISKEFNVAPVKLNQIDNILPKVNIIICSSAGGEIVNLREIKKINQQKIIFDFGVPANIPNEITKLKNIEYFTFEHANKLIANDTKNKKEIKSFLKNKIHMIIEKKIGKADKDLSALFLLANLLK